MNKTEAIEVFSKCSIFEGLNAVELGKLADGCYEQNFATGSVIIEENEAPKEALFFIKDGEIVVTTTGINSHADDSESETFITTLGQGDAFGEIALVDKMPHSANIKSITDSTVIILPSTYFYSIVENDKNIGYIVMRNISRVICQRLRNTNYATKHFAQWGKIDEQPQETD